MTSSGAFSAWLVIRIGIYLSRLRQKRDERGQTSRQPSLMPDPPQKARRRVLDFGPMSCQTADHRMLSGRGAAPRESAQTEFRARRRALVLELIGAKLGREKEYALGGHLPLRDQPLLRRLAAPVGEEPQIVFAYRRIREYQAFHLGYRQRLGEAERGARLVELLGAVGAPQVLL